MNGKLYSAVMWFGAICWAITSVIRLNTAVKEAFPPLPHIDHNGNHTGDMGEPCNRDGTCNFENLFCYNHLIIDNKNTCEVHQE